MTVTAKELAQRIDHTLLAPEVTPDQIDRLCEEAVEFGFAAVCVNPVYVERAANRLDAMMRGRTDERRPAVVSVAGFPLGASTTATKADEARRAIDNGASEIDMVARIGALIGGDRAAVRRDIAALAEVVHQQIDHGVLKVILECGALTAEQVILGCRCCAEGEADFVKTSTGMHACGGATVEMVELLYRHVSPMLVKAAGSIRTPETAIDMMAAGAARIGTSSGVAIIEALRASNP